MIILTPAYGRDYKSKSAVLADWLGGKDFVLHAHDSPWDGKLINKAQADDSHFKDIWFRYDRLRKICHLVKGKML